mmetsp:Transcript_4308/g.9300  ORF Transcript_4308/g.9300 Transcript_4308/m.9300 type:complete len:234 (+) Transcript_4308:693-1394(+)
MRIAKRVRPVSSLDAFGHLDRQVVEWAPAPEPLELERVDAKPQARIGAVKLFGPTRPVRTSQSTRLVPEPSEPRRARIVDAFALGTHHKLITMIKRDPWRRLDHLPAAIELSQLANHQYEGHEKEHETAPRSQRGTLLFGRPLDTPRFQTAGTAGALIRSRSLLGLAMPLRAGIRNNPRGCHSHTLRRHLAGGRHADLLPFLPTRDQTVIDNGRRLRKITPPPVRDHDRTVDG